jgi:hypothetical protein
MASAGIILTAGSVSGAAPNNPAQLASRLTELRGQLAPYLRSLPAKAETRTQTSLSGDDWLSRFEIKRVSEKPVKELAPRPPSPGWEKEALDVSSWQPTSVPEWRYDSLAVQQPASCILWYRKTFAATPPPPGHRVFLVFEGVDWEAEVWLNGRRQGSHRVYFEPFRFEVTTILAATNTLAVRVIDGPQFGEPAAFWAPFPLPPAKEPHYVRDRAKSLLGQTRGDTHNGSGYGIHRDVYLETTAEAVITDIRARGYPARNEATVQVDTDVSGEQAAKLLVELLPENFEGATFRNSLTLPAQTGSSRQTVTVPMPQARRWTPETPWLYRCRASLLNGAGQVLDVHDVLFGHRSLELVSEGQPRRGLQPGTLLLDGTPLFLRGANIQGLNALWFWGEHDKLLNVLLLLKAANYNAVRSCQHVTFPEVRELQDRLGILSQQDVGSRYPNLGQHVRPGLLAACAALARHCYNNPAVALISFANETDFDPTDMLRAALAEDPDRLFKPISGHPHGGTAFPHSGREGYRLTDDLWDHVLDDVHPYWGWYGYPGQVSRFCQVLPPDRMVTVGEYGGEALDSYETMADYPADWGARPAKDADVLWGQVQVTKDDVRQREGFRGRRPSNLGEYITASQNYQYDLLAEATKSWRISARRIAGYFQFHFVDVVPVDWPKAIVSHDLTPKRAYFAMAQVNQPLVPLPRLVNGGQAMELWVANDLPQAWSNCVVRWRVLRGSTPLAQGTQSVDVPASDAALAGVAALTSLPEDASVVQLELVLERSSGEVLSRYNQEVYLAAWKATDNSASLHGFPLYHSFEEMARATNTVLAPVRPVTHGPQFHWFGYYDKFQFDVTGRYLLSLEVNFEHRLPKPNEAVKVGMVDLANGDKWIELGESRAWCWQQGCMLQWRPGSDCEVVWNDREGDHFVCRVFNVKTHERRTLPRAIGHLSPDGTTAVCEDFSRLWDFRAGYGYPGIPDPYAGQTAPAEIGVWRMDMTTGETRLLVSLADLVKIPYPGQTPQDKHYVNHLQWTPDGQRFMLFDRWSGPKQPTRVFSISAEGQDLKLLSAKGASHYMWRDSRQALIWADAYKLYQENGSGEPTETLWAAPNGHQSYLPGTTNQWVLTDTYPYGRNRDQVLYLFHVPTRRFLLLGKFPSPAAYTSEWRCDTHPRVSRDGKSVVIDSAHGGNGRQQYRLDLTPILGGKRREP